MGIFATDRLRAGLAFATHKHEGQLRNYTGLPYITHPIAVATAVSDYLDEDGMLAALFHDLIENTDTTLAEIQAGFGHRVADLVDAVTDVSRPEDGSRAVRKALDRAHIASAAPDAQTIKAADILDNASGGQYVDAKFAAIYLPEKRLALDVLSKAHPALLLKAHRAVGCAAQHHGISL